MQRSTFVNARWVALLTALVALQSGAAATAANFQDARYDADEDELVVTLGYRGTNPDHTFSIEWGECKLDGVAGSYQISARVLDSQWNDAARQSFMKTARFDLRNLRCRPAIVTLFTAPQFRISVMVPARADADRRLRGPRTDAIHAQQFRSSLSGGDLLQRCGHAIDVLHGVRLAAAVDALAGAMYCLGFVEAAADAGAFLGVLNAPMRPSRAGHTQRSIRNCAGPGVDSEQLLDTIVQFLEDNPASSEQSAVTMSMLAIARAFPCDTPV
jgi:hypothetical protein